MLKKCITCPVCNGTKKLLNNKSCTNCGGQTQFGISTGFTFINIENKLHFQGETTWIFQSRAYVIAM